MRLVNMARNTLATSSDAIRSVAGPIVENDTGMGDTGDTMASDTAGV